MDKLSLTPQIEVISEKQMKEINGGHWLVAAILFQATMEIIDGSFWDDVRRGHDQVYC